MFHLENAFDRFAEWKNFREKIEQSEDPVAEVIHYYNDVERHSLRYDPWNKNSWPSPWQLVEENQYCSFSIILGIIYSCMLCDRFSKDQFFVIILQNITGEIGYAFSVNNKIYSLDYTQYQILNQIAVEQKK